MIGMLKNLEKENYDKQKISPKLNIFIKCHYLLYNIQIFL